MRFSFLINSPGFPGVQEIGHILPFLPPVISELGGSDVPEVTYRIMPKAEGSVLRFRSGVWLGASSTLVLAPGDQRSTVAWIGCISMYTA
jgi:hypothetical protein